MMSLLDANSDAHFERSLAVEVKRRASDAGLTVAALTAQAGLDRRTFERWFAGATTLGMRNYLALLRTVQHAEKIQHRAAQKSARSGIK
jgi:transcriptional regulator GlxA family with amidase domain